MLKFLAKFAIKWYITDSKFYWGEVIKFIKVMDRDFGLIANVYNWLSPLYGDYSYIGRVAGPIFRTFRIFMAAIFYLVVIFAAFFVYIFWLALPVIIAAMIFSNLAALF